MLIGFVVMHLIGNLQFFAGPQVINEYGTKLRHLPFGLIWVMRLGLLGVAVAHIATTIILIKGNRAAKGEGYVKKSSVQSRLATRIMALSGIILLSYIVFHILQFTTGTVHPSVWVAGDPYGNVIRAFHVPWVVALYVVSMAAVGLHLFHGTWSSFRSLGLVKPSEHALRHKTSLLVAGLVWLGFTIIPLAIFAGVGR